MSDPLSILWTADRHAQEWKDTDVLRMVDWLCSFVPAAAMSRRLDAVQRNFEAAKEFWSAGQHVPMFDPNDAIAWYIFQARCYGDWRWRADCFEPQSYRIAPLFVRLGHQLEVLRSIGGVEDRVERMMRQGKAQPDDAIYELLIALGYKRSGWRDVRFVPETPGRSKSPDLLALSGRRGWAVECKRTGRSGYARDERIKGERLAQGLHDVSVQERRPLLMSVRFNHELIDLPDNYLAEKATTLLGTRKRFVEWEDEFSAGRVGDVDWIPLRIVLATDDIHFGSSRMIELLLGQYAPEADYSMAGEWIPGEDRPLHATEVNHVSLVAWVSRSEKAALRKARHFRSVVGSASKQLPGDLNGAVHVGYEAIGGNSVDALRHRLNAREIRSFDAGESRLRWVMANYLVPEHSTDKNESAALTEMTAWYRVGRHSTKQPLSKRMLFKDEDE